MIRLSYVAIACALVAGSPTWALTADVEVTGLSFSMGPAATSAGTMIYFTTFDGAAGEPLLDCAGGLCTFSQEFSPVALGSATYHADYLAVDELGIFEWGDVVVTLSSGDQDADGVLDVLERPLASFHTFSGTAVPDFNAYGIYLNSAVSGQISRAASSYVGSYSGAFANATVSATMSGDFALSGGTGTVEYTLGGDTLAWHLSQRDRDGTFWIATGTSQLVRIGTSAVQLPAFSLHVQRLGVDLAVHGTTLTRSGSEYAGIVILADGGPQSSWPDYTTYRVVITDPNDADADGVPDLSAVPEPSAHGLGLAACVSLSLLAHRRTSRNTGRRPAEETI